MRPGRRPPPAGMRRPGLLRARRRCRSAPRRRPRSMGRTPAPGRCAPPRARASARTAGRPWRRGGRAARASPRSAPPARTTCASMSFSPSRSVPSAISLSAQSRRRSNWSRRRSRAASDAVGIGVRQRALQQRGDVGKARLEPGSIVGKAWACSLPLRASLGHCRLRGTLAAAARLRDELGLRRLVGPHQRPPPTADPTDRPPLPARPVRRRRHARCRSARPVRKRRCAPPGRRSPARCGSGPRHAAPAARRGPGRAAGRTGPAAPACRRSHRGVRATYPAVCCFARRRAWRFPGGRIQRGNACPRARPASGGPVG